MGKSTLSKVQEEAIVLKKTQVPEETMKTLEKTFVPNNEDISILYTYLREIWDRKKTVIDDIFAFAVATKVSKGNDDNDQEPRTLNECQQRKYWLK